MEDTYIEETLELNANRRDISILDMAVCLAMLDGEDEKWYKQYTFDRLQIPNLNQNDCITYLEFLIEKEKSIADDSNDLLDVSTEYLDLNTRKDLDLLLSKFTIGCF